MYKAITDTSYVLMVIIAAEVAIILAVVVYKMLRGDIDLRYLLSEPGAEGKASLSRFQFFVFTFVIAGLYLMLCMENGQFVEVPNSALALLGISGGSYLISKGIPKKQEDETK